MSQSASEAYALLNQSQMAYQAILADNLIGLYVHGSLAMDCFFWDQSDIDCLVVVKAEPSLTQKEALIRTLLRLNPSAPKKGFEMSVMLQADCHHFQHPAPYRQSTLRPADPGNLRTGSIRRLLGQHLARCTKRKSRYHRAACIYHFKPLPRASLRPGRTHFVQRAGRLLGPVPPARMPSASCARSAKCLYWQRCPHFLRERFAAFC